jgi:Zn-finger nucleic acid-binding protein
MPELSPRLPCPVCLGTTMEKLAIGPGGALQIDHCRRCGGVWLEHGEVQQMRTLKEHELWQQVEPRHFAFRMRCHDCHAPMERADEACPACGWTNLLDCPACQHPMRVEMHAGLRLDLCRGCKGIWFDHHELKAIWSASFDRALRKGPLPHGTAAGAVADGAASHALFDVLFFGPDLAYHGARAAGHAAVAAADLLSQLPEAIAGTPEAAASVFEAAGEASGSVFGVVVEIIGGIFEGL